MSLGNADDERPRALKSGKWIVLFALLVVVALISWRVVPPLVPLRPADQQLVDAVNRDDVVAVRALLSRGADPNTRSVPTDLWEPPVSTVIQRVWLRVSRPESRREPVLTAAASRGDADIVTALLDKGANPDVLDADGFTPLMRAVTPWPNDRPITPTVEALLTHGARVNVRTGQGMTALMYASSGGALPVVKLLLGKGADANVHNSDGNTALEFARHHPEVASLLRRAGAKLSP